MKKFGLFSVLVLGLVLVAGCLNQQDMSSDDVMAVWEKNHEMTCDMNYETDGEKGSAIMYVKDDMLRQDVVMQTQEGKFEMFTVIRDGKMYMWDDTNNGFSMDYDSSVSDEIALLASGDEGIMIRCKNNVKDNNVFDLPSDVSFSNADDFDGGFYENIEMDEDLDGVNGAENVDEEIPAEG